ncbi:MAG: peptidoglycan-binding protein [Deltaproteobacteria bacterium]
MTTARYLLDDINLMRGSVDDYGDARYLRLTQNVPDGYVYDLQTDLRRLGCAEVGEEDGAFGKTTKKAVEMFQELAKLGKSGIVDPTTKDEIRLWLEHKYTKNNPPRPEAGDAPLKKDGYKMITPRVPHFSQGDPRWANRVLGMKSSIARQGCAISCIAMILRFYGRTVTPATLDEFLDRESGYSGDSVIWAVAGRCGESGQDTLTYARKEGGEVELHAFLSERMEQNLPTMIRVDYGVDPGLAYNHFVVGVGKTDDGNFVMNDPATRQGDGYANFTDDNIIQKTSRKNGYRIVQLDWYDRPT